MAVGATSASILRAQLLAKSVTEGIFVAEKTIAANKEIQKQEAAREQERLQNIARGRVRLNEEVVKEDEERIFGTDAAIKKASGCIRSVQHARYSHFAAAQVTERRLELRRDRRAHLQRAYDPYDPMGESQRPSTVANQDAVQTALQQEQRTLGNARERLLALERQARSVIQDLEAVRGYLSHDAAKRRFAVEQDRAYIISFGSVTAGGPLPSPADVDEEEVAKARQMCRYVFDLEDRVELTCTTSASAIRKYRDEYAQVHAVLEEELSKSTYMLGDLGKRLKGQAKEVDTTTRMAERSLGEIKKKNLTKGDDVGASKVAELEKLVDNLRVTRGLLQDDIRSKTVLLDIDERCRKVTTVGEKLFEEKKVRGNRSAPNLRATGTLQSLRSTGTLQKSSLSSTGKLALHH